MMVGVVVPCQRVGMLSWAVAMAGCEEGRNLGRFGSEGPSGHCVAVDRAESGKRPDRKWGLQARGSSWRNQCGGQSGQVQCHRGCMGTELGSGVCVCACVCAPGSQPLWTSGLTGWAVRGKRGIRLTGTWSSGSLVTR